MGCFHRISMEGHWNFRDCQKTQEKQVKYQVKKITFSAGKDKRWELDNKQNFNIKKGFLHQCCDTLCERKTQ